MSNVNNRGHVKQGFSGLLGGQIADDAATAESKFLSLRFRFLICGSCQQWWREVSNKRL